MPRVAHHNAVRTCIDKARFDEVMKLRGYFFFNDFYAAWAKRYGLDITYKSFVGLLENKHSWKLDYAFTICDMLKTDIRDLFYLIKNEDN